MAIDGSVIGATTRQTNGLVVIKYIKCTVDRARYRLADVTARSTLRMGQNRQKPRGKHQQAYSHRCFGERVGNHFRIYSGTSLMTRTNICVCVLDLGTILPLRIFDNDLDFCRSLLR